MFGFLYLFRKIFLRVSRPLMRLQGVTRAPVLSQVSDTLNGLETVRTFRIQDSLISELCWKQVFKLHN